MAECRRVNLADVVLRLEGGSTLLCHCTRAKFSSAAPPRNGFQSVALKANCDHEKSSETFTDDFEQIFQFDEQQQPIEPQPPCVPFNAESRWSFLNHPKSFSEDSSPSLSWSSSSDSMTSVTSLDEAMLSLSSSDSEEEDSQKARFDAVNVVEDTLNRLSISPSRQNGNSKNSSLSKSMGQATIIPVQDAMRYFGYQFLPTNEDSTVTSTEIISLQKDKVNAAEHLIKSKKQLGQLKFDKKEVTCGDWLSHLAKRGACDVVVDALCGDGALAVQLAQNCKKVIAIDSDPLKIKEAQHRVFSNSLSHKVEFVLGDFLQLQLHLEANAVYLRLSNSNTIFEQQELFQQAKAISNNIVFCLPSNQDARQVLQLVGQGEMELEQCCIEGHFSAMAAYSGPLFDQTR